MNLFQCVKAAVTTKQAAEYYGIQVGQNSMIRCPFHDDHHPSMKVDVRYYCFACHATGDVISFTAHLFGLSIYEAARKLAVDFGIDPRNPTGVMRQPTSSEETRLRCLENVCVCVSVLTEFLVLLRKWHREHAPEFPDLLDERYITSCQMLPHIEFLIDVLLSRDDKTKKTVLDMLTEDGKILRLQEFLNRSRDTCDDEAA